ncbi:MAG TPA: acyltransferase domain-containing protein [Actinomycetota bacterium]|nr:acyltransferase domain-containing protein [Actinomycetota bacterium]
MQSLTGSARPYTLARAADKTSSTRPDDGGRAVVFPGRDVTLDALDAALRRAPETARAAAQVLGFDVARKTRVAARSATGSLPAYVEQPALVAASVASWHAGGRPCDFVAGHGAGELAALAAAGAISFEDAIELAAVRGEALSAAARASSGATTAVLGLDPDHVATIARRAGVHVAHDDAPGRAVLAGPEDALARAAALVTSAGGRAVLLGGSGPTNTPAMAAAAVALGTALERVDVRMPSIPVVSTIAARPFESPGDIRTLVAAGVVRTVRFRDAVAWLWSRGVRVVDDAGPGSCAASLAHITMTSLEDEEVEARA